VKKIGLVGYLSLFILTFGLDRITKFLALKYLDKSDFEVVSGFFSFGLSFNRGVTGGLFSFDARSSFLLLSFIIFLIIIGFIVYTIKLYNQGFSIWAQTLVAAGALSKFLDRILYGGVVDFIDIYFKDWHWPTFNVADAAIVIGVFFIIWGSFSYELHGRN
jgi:signal peptidase II